MCYTNSCILYHAYLSLKIGPLYRVKGNWATLASIKTVNSYRLRGKCCFFSTKSNRDDLVLTDQNERFNTTITYLLL